MIAYNSGWLNNLYIQKQAKEAFIQNLLDKDEWDTVINKYPVNFYTTNLFIRIGLFILTTIIVLFSFGLFALLMSDSIERAIGAMAVFLGLIIYGALEYLVQTKKHFQSGVDDALLWLSACTLFGGISFLTDAGELANCFIVFIISLYASLRFADRLMCVVWYASLLGLFYLTFIKMGQWSMSILPFVIMTLSVIIYLLAGKMKRLKINHIYCDCLEIISIASLLVFYIAGNYYVVRELSNSFINHNQVGKEVVQVGWLFWLITVVVPFCYLFYGVKRKNIVFIRVGLLLVAATIVTVRYYYSVVPIEVAMAAGGFALIVISYGLTRYLKQSRFGFTYDQTHSSDTQRDLQMESLLQVQTFAGEPAPAETTKFGGGGFGGGGASGDY